MKLAVGKRLVEPAVERHPQRAPPLHYKGMGLMLMRALALQRMKGMVAKGNGGFCSRGGAICVRIVVDTKDAVQMA